MRYVVAGFANCNAVTWPGELTQVANGADLSPGNLATDFAKAIRVAIKDCWFNVSRQRFVFVAFA